MKVTPEQAKALLEDGTFGQLLASSQDMARTIMEMGEIVKAVAHIGVDFGFGKYELEEKHIDAARKILEADNG